MSTLQERLDKDFKELPECIRNSGNGQRCLTLIATLCDMLPEQYDPSDTTAAVLFDHDELSISLLVHCTKQKRQVSFEVRDGGGALRIIRLDESMRRLCYECDPSEDGLIKETVAWLTCGAGGSSFAPAVE